MQRTTLKQFWQAFVRSAKDEGRFLLTHRWDFSVTFWLPLIAIFLVWWVFAKNHIEDLSIGVIDYNHSQLSDTLIRYLDASPELQVKQLYPSDVQAKNALLEKSVYGVVIIPVDFDTKIMTGQSSPVILQVNAQYGTYSGIIQKGTQAVVGTFSAGTQIQTLIKKGTFPKQAQETYTPISIQRVSLFNAGSNYQQFLASTVIPALLHILAMVIGATTVGREIRDRRLGDWYEYISGKTKERDILPADFSPSELAKTQPIQQQGIGSNIWILIAGLNGKFIWSMLAYTLWGAVTILLIVNQNFVSFGSGFITYVAFLLLMMLSFWMGAIFTLASYSLRMGLSTTGFISAPSYAFAGVTFPYIAITNSAKYWADLLPLTHYLKVQIAQLQMKAPAMISLPIIYGFIIAVLACLFISALLTKRDLKHPERWGQR